MDLDRRTFILGTASGVMMLAGACTPGRQIKGGPPTTLIQPTLDPSTLPPAARPTVRVPGAAFGFPSPFAYTAKPGYTQASLVYDTLMWKDGTGKVLPWLASRFEQSSDGLVYTFELRDGIRWHDGRPLTAEDVAFTFDYFASHTFGPLIMVQPFGIAKVEALTPTRVQVRLERPSVTFVDFIAAAVPIVPRHVWSSIDDPSAAQEKELLVGSGPYRVASYDGDQAPLLYTANDDYFLGRPFVERIEMIPVSDEFTALLAGEVDVAQGTFAGTRPEVLTPFRADEKFGVVETTGQFTYTLYWNLDKGGVLGDVRFRRACALAVDRQDVVQRLTGGNGKPGNPGFLSQSNPFYTEVEQYRFDPRAAGKLLDEMGYPRPSGGGTRRNAKGKELRFELLYPTEAQPLAEVVIDGMDKVGVKLVARGVELGPALYGQKLGGGYEMAIALYPGPSGPTPDADPDLLRPLFSSLAAKGLNSANGYSDSEFNDLAERQLATVDESERRKMVGRMQEILARDIPALAMYYPTLYAAFRRPVFDQWYWTPGGYPVETYNRQVFVTGVKGGSVIRPLG